MIHSIFQRARANSFLKNVSILAFGTIISQAILLAFTPFLTRLFGPSDFGILAVFTSVSTMAAILTTGRYELAIALPDENSDAIQVAGLVVFLGGIVSAFYLVSIFIIKMSGLFKGQFNGFFDSPMLYLVPLSTFFAASFSALQYWYLRLKKYKKITVSNAMQVIAATVFNLLFGIIGYTHYGLVFGFLIGQTAGILWLLIALYKAGMIVPLRISDMRQKAKQHSAFPRYMIISDFSSTTSQQIIPVIFSVLFNTAVVGFFALANRMLKIPAIVLTSSITNVFRNDALDAIRETGNCDKLYRSTFKKLLVIAIPIFTVIGIFSPFLFSRVFGDEWISAGIFARIICFMVILDFLVVPFNSLFYVFNRQKLYMQIQFVKTIVNIAFIYLGYRLFGDPYYSIIFFVLSDIIFSVITLYITYNLSHNSVRNQKN